MNSPDIAVISSNSFFDRSKLFVNGALVVDDEGLHGMVEKCGQRVLTSGSHTVYIEGFQAGGGVGMEAKYSGPDTGGKVIFMRSGVVPSSNSVSGPYYPTCDPNVEDSDGLKFTLCMFRSEISIGKIPALGQADTGSNRLYFVGKGRLPVVDVHNVDQFRVTIPGTPETNYAWAIYGKLMIDVSGIYSLCIISDDGYQQHESLYSAFTFNQTNQHSSVICKSAF